jgi:hypothetical protein
VPPITGLKPGVNEKGTSWRFEANPLPGRAEKRVARKTVLREIARANLAGADISVLGKIACAFGLSRADTGLGNPQLEER